MIRTFAKRIFGSPSERIVKKYKKIADEVSALEGEFSKLNDDELREKTSEFKQRIADGEPLDYLLPEAFAVVREAAKRVLGLRPFDVQIIGGIALHNGQIAEMKTGEGKTLVAVLAVYLNALEGKGVHVVTVNDYLAARDAEWMGKIYRFLGMSVGIIVNSLSDEQRREAYNCDITYATNNELGFDYLRDNMKFRKEDLVMRPFNYAIVDEVDSILIDEARTPLIISGAAKDNVDMYVNVDAVIPLLRNTDYEIDEKQKHVTLTEQGNDVIENLLFERGITKTKNLYDVINMDIVHYVNQALKAHLLFKRDVDYIVKDGKIIIIDEFTGRMMDGRRYSDGLHQAIEAKEHVRVRMENQTLASITFQNFFRMYKKLAGMTGTAETEAAELQDIYKVETVVIPTNVPVARIDYDDEIYRTNQEKYEAILKLIKECHARKQPVLVGTISIESSEKLSEFLKKFGIEHNVLNARYHDIEAEIIAEAGRPGAVTIATNMAGRGTDIKLGGNLDARINKETAGIEDPELRRKREQEIIEEIKRDEDIARKAGGLFVIGTERHESRRIDNQLRGRSGRQGDAGASKFFLSLQDDLMRIFGAERLDSMLQKLGLQEGEAITHPWVNKAVEKAQGRVEARNCDIRKHLLKYDDVMNDQRKVIYSQRLALMDPQTDLRDELVDMRYEVIDKIINTSIPENVPSEHWDFNAVNESVHYFFGADVKDFDANEIWTKESLRQTMIELVEGRIKEKEGKYPSDVLRNMERSVMLRLIDKLWKEHLLNLDIVRQGINLRAYGQRDPLNEYKQEAFSLFERMVRVIREETVRTLSVSEPNDGYYFDDDPFGGGNNGDSFDADLLAEFESILKKYAHKSNFVGGENSDDNALSSEDEKDLSSDKDDVSNVKVNRNALCPCGSGKRYKHCCGRMKD